jgi:uncharacterized protein involved in exopolysaccharide biosynthesis
MDQKGFSGGLGGLASAAAAFGVNVPGAEGSDGNFVDILQSRTIREQLAKTEFKFKQRKWRFGPEVQRSETLEKYLESKNLDRAVADVGRMIFINKDLKSKIILLSAETRSPELSQLIVEKATALLEAFIQQKGRTRGGAKAAFAEARLDETRKEFAKTEEELREFLNNNRGYLTSTDPNIKLRGLRLEAEYKLRSQLVTTLSLSREQALLDEKNDIPILNVMDVANLPVEKSGPSRGKLVLLVFLIGVVASWTWLNRAWIKQIIQTSEA